MSAGASDRIRVVGRPPFSERLLEWLFLVTFAVVGILVPLIWLVVMAPLRLWRAHRPAGADSG